MERIKVFTESDEYTTLRNEMMTLFAHARQMLYWTTGFVIASMGWWMSQDQKLTVPPWCRQRI